MRRLPPGRKSIAGSAGPTVGVAMALLVVAVGAGSCRCLRGPVNASPALRWWLFSNFGAGKICPEMVKRGLGLRLQDRGPIVGRFFPNGCTVDVDNPKELITVNFAGTGYAFTTVSRRVGFRCTASVQYRADFYLGEEDIYVWGKVNRIVHGPAFELGFVENPAVDIATSVTPLGAIANAFGNQIVAGELTRGFTVLQNWDTDSKSFALGILMPPRKPASPFDVSRDELYTFANETTEVQVNQRDFLGPFEVVHNGEKLVVKYFLQGPPIDVMVVAKPTGEMWREAYQLGRPLGQPPGQVLAGAPLYPGRQTVAAYPLPAGEYYVVLDNTAAAGTVAPPTSLLDPLGANAVARVSYVAQLAER